MKYLMMITLVAFSVSTAHAQQQGGVVVGGDVQIKAKTGDVVTTAEDKSIAETNIGSVTGDSTAVGGDVNIKVQTGDVTTTAKGDSKACSNIGMVGTSACQKK